MTLAPPPPVAPRLRCRATGDGHLACRRRHRLQGERNDLAVALEENMAAAAVRHDPKSAVAQMRESVGDRLADGDANDRNAQSEADAMRQREARADAGERARPDRHRDQVDAGSVCARLVQHLPRHHRQDGLMPCCVRAWFGAMSVREATTIVGHHRRGAARQRGIQDQDAHRAVSVPQARMHASSNSSRGERLNTPLQSP